MCFLTRSPSGGSGPLVLLLAVALLLAAPSKLRAQPSTCDPSPVMTSFCADACVICNIDGFSGRNADPPGGWDAPRNFCARTLHNLQWIGFIAGTPDLTLQVAVSNCVRMGQGTNGLQIGIFEATGCNMTTSRRVSTCDSDVSQGQTAVLTNTVPLVPGQYYYLVIDGNNDDVCDFSVAVTQGTTQVPAVTQGGGISGPATACIGDPTTYTTNPVPNAPNHYWTLNGLPLPGASSSRTVTFPAAGTYTVCVQASNTCSTSPPECQTVLVAPTTTTNIAATICGSGCYTYEGFPLCNPGVFGYTFTNVNGCDSIVRLTLTRIPGLTATINAAACAGSTVNVRGRAYAPGTHTLRSPGPPGGCDTTLTIQVATLPTRATTVNAAICPGGSYTFGSTTLSAAGTYTDRLTAANGCDSTVTLNLSVRPPASTTRTELVCNGGTATIGTEVFATSGTYTRVLPGPNGCDSTVTLNLTVRPPLTATRSAALCPGASVRVGTQTYSTAGTYTATFPAPGGCDSVVTLTVIARAGGASTTAASICPGGNYVFNGRTYTTAGTYTATLPAASGCDSVATLVLDVESIVRTNLAATICAGESYPFNGQTLTSTGVYPVSLLSAAGCDSVVTLSLTVRPPAGITRAETICFGQSAQIGTEVFTTTDRYTRVLTGANGCDSTVVLDLTVRAAAEATRSYTICSDQQVRVGPQNYSLPGTYVINFPGPGGCDSVVTLTLAVIPAYDVTVAATICPGGSYRLGNQTLTAPGRYRANLRARNGCDSAVTLDLGIAPAIRTTERATVCAGDTYLFNGNTYGVAGNYVAVFPSAQGCDSIVTLELSVDPSASTTRRERICQGQSVSVGTQTFTTSGVYPVTLTTVAGCDSVVTLELTVSQPSAASVTETLCPGDFFLVDGQAINRPGTYRFVLTNRAGCDSVLDLRLRAGAPALTTLDARFCTGTSYTFNGQTYTQGGTYNAVLQTRDGCDSLVVLNLTETGALETNLAATICTGQTYRFGGASLRASGRYTETYRSTAGCDSIVTLDLTVVSDLSTALAITRCAGQSYRFDGVDRTATGIYSATFTSAGGCDSTVTLDLTVLPRLATALRETICAGASIEVGGQTFTRAGPHVVTLVGRGGCDSVVTLDLTVVPAVTTPLARTICAGGSVSVGTQTFTTAGTYTVPLTGAAGCDSTVVLTLDIGQEVRLAEQRAICAGATTTYRGVSYGQAGTYPVRIDGVGADCDTLVTLTVVAAPPLSSRSSATICAGQTFAFGGTPLDAAGTYRDTLPSLRTGCDSIVTLSLSVSPARDTAFAKTLCAGEVLTVGDRDLDRTGRFAVPLVTAAGCDSTVTVDLLVLDPIARDTTLATCGGAMAEFRGQQYSAPGTYALRLAGSGTACDTLLSLAVTTAAAPNVTLARQICVGDSLRFDGRWLTGAGTYTAVTPTAAGCDSTTTLTLTIGGNVTDERSLRVCAGQSVNYRGVEYASAGVFDRTLPGAAGSCDTLLRLTVRVDDPSASTLTDTICAGGTYRFDGRDLTAAGTYAVTLSDARGCDSTVTLGLAVRPALTGQATARICAGETYTFGSQRLTRAGSYTERFTGSGGCDSTVSLRLSIAPRRDTSLTAGICRGSSYGFGARDLTDAGTYLDTLQSRLGCDSVIALTLTVSDSIVRSLSAEICAGQTFPFAGVARDQPGTYRTVAPSRAGCDSITVLTLAVVDTLRTALTRRICTGDTTGFGGSLVTAAGTYRQSLLARSGCDSLVTLELGVDLVYAIAATGEICAGGTYRFGDQDLVAAGTYTQQSSTIAGCDSTVTLTLAVVDTVRGALAGEICEGQSYAFGGRDLTIAGTYRAVGQAASGCDSVTTLTLAVVDTLRGALAGEICEGESYAFDGRDLTMAGSYRALGQAASGCDSVTTLTLAVLPTPSGMLDTTLCEGAALTLGGVRYDAAGTYDVRLQAANGCDSTLTLRLSFRACNTPTVTGTALQVSCFGGADGGLAVELAGWSLPLEMRWGPLGGALDSLRVLTVLPQGAPVELGGLTAGPYRLRLSDANGREDELTWTIAEPPLLTADIALEARGDYALACAGDADAIADLTVAGGTPPYRYRWPDGSTGARVQGLAAGQLWVEIEDARGCPLRVEAEVSAPEPFVAEARAVAIDCADPLLGGRIEITNAAGGQPPYVFLLDGAPGEEDEVWGGLAAGTYTLEARDAAGCDTTMSLRLRAPESPKLDLGADRTIDYGDTLTLRVVSTLPLDSMRWTASGGYISCDTCARPRVAPVGTTDYRVEAWGPGGCPSSDVMQLLVRAREGVYVPTAFSPNADGVNDNFTIYAAAPGTRIVALEVYDRWGGLVWRRADFAPGDVLLGWDGYHRGKLVDPAVFVYWARIRMPDGREELLKGDLTVLR